MADKAQCLYQDCEVKPRNGQYCHKHKKAGIIIRQQSEYLADINQDKSSDTQVSSNIYMVINTNRTDRASADMLVRITDYLFSQQKILEFIKDLGGNSEISDLEVVQGCIEAGGKFHKIHSNSLIKIKHNGRIQIDLTKLRQFLNKIMGYTPNIRVSVIKNPNEDWVTRYIYKDAPKAL